MVVYTLSGVILLYCTDIATVQNLYHAGSEKREKITRLQNLVYLQNYVKTIV